MRYRSFHRARHTSKRIFERLRDENGYTGGITIVIVKDYVRAQRLWLEPLCGCAPAELSRLPTRNCDATRRKFRCPPDTDAGGRRRVRSWIDSMSINPPTRHFEIRTALGWSYPIGSKGLVHGGKGEHNAPATISVDEVRAIVRFSERGLRGSHAANPRDRSFVGVSGL
jgi:hypothetical protein